MTDFPSNASVVIVGGGAMGCSTLYHLAKAGITDAILIERNELTSGTTWHSAAQVRALRSSRNLTEMIRYSISLYAGLEEETGQATGWINKGSLSIATGQDRLTHIMRQADLADLYGIEASRISAGEAQERWPLMNADDVIGAVWSPGDGRVSPSDLCAALIKAAKRHGAGIFEQTSLAAINTRNGRVHSIETSQGVIRCDALVLCTGLWSREAGALAGRDIPLWPCEHFYLLTKPIAGIEGNLATLSDHDSHLYIRDDSGGLLIGCFEPHAKAIAAEQLGQNFAFQLLNEDWDHFEPMMEAALHRLPALAEAEVKTLLNGPESFTPDGHFYLGETPETAGLYLGCGMNSVGLASAGGAGMAIAHSIVHGKAPFDLGELHPGRFPEGVFGAKALCERAPEVLGKHYEITYPGRQWQTARDLTKHPLKARFDKANASYGQVYGFERPLFFGAVANEPLTFDRPAWFEQVAKEVSAAHNGCALFDLTTFGKAEIQGADACNFLNHVCANAMDRPTGSAIYTQMLNQEGRILSDLVALRLDQERYRLSLGTNAARLDLAWLHAHKNDARITIDDVSSDLATLALMGPQSERILRELEASAITELRYFRGGMFKISGIPVIAVRLSYVGEKGFEITTDVAHAEALWDLFVDVGVVPAGLYAQTSMRIEKRHLSYGHDIDSDMTPLEAGLDFAIAWDTDFIGSDAIHQGKTQSHKNRAFSIVLEDENAVPIGDEPVIADGRMIGKVTSAAFGYRIDRPVAIALLDKKAALSPPNKVVVRIAREDFEATLQSQAPFDPTGSVMKR